MKWRNVLFVLLAALPLLVLLAYGFTLDPHSVPSVLPGKPAPECELTGLDSTKTSLKSFIGRPLVINFWASWCTPCEMEHELLQRAARRAGDSTQFIGVVYQDEADKAQRYLTRHGSSYPQLLDPGSRCAIDFGVAGVPETFFIDSAGRIFDKQVGPVTSESLFKTLGNLSASATP